MYPRTKRSHFKTGSLIGVKVYRMRKMSLISALIVLMKSCKFWCWKTEPKQQVEQEQDVDRINE